MVTLYESILSSTKSGRSKFVFTEFISALNKINGITKMQKFGSYIHFPKGFVPDSLYADPGIVYIWTSLEDGEKINSILDDFFKIGYKPIRKKITGLQDLSDFEIKRYKSDQKFYIIETVIFKLNENTVCLKLITPTELNRDKRYQLLVSFFDENKKCVNKEIIKILD